MASRSGAEAVVCREVNRTVRVKAIMRKVLFLDEKYDAVGGTRWLMRSVERWRPVYVRTADEALRALDADEGFDAVVINPQSTVVSGAAFLAEVMRRHPRTVRIVLSDRIGQEELVRWLGPAHRRLSRSCSTSELEDALERACALRDLLTNESLQRIVSQINSLPSLPAVYAELVEELQTAQPSVRKIGEIIARDVALTAKVLQVVNSAFFGLRRRITSPAEATMFLGLDAIVSLVLAINVFSQFEAQRLPRFSPTALWTHSLQTGLFAKRIASLERQSDKNAEEAFTAGLLHDAGKIVLATALPEWYEQALALMRKEELSFAEAEREVFGTTHAEVGAYLFGLWGLPDQIVEAVAFHHRPQDAKANDFCALTAVHVANAIEHEGRAERAQIDADYLDALRLIERFTTWQQACAKMRIEPDQEAEEA
ncbi:MAG: two-component system response regulator [Pyrinomonas sp.]